MNTDKMKELLKDYTTEPGETFNNQIKMIFDNGLILSIVSGEYSYGGKEGLFEIAPINLEGELDGSLLDISGDDVEGWLTEEVVMKRVRIMEEWNGQDANN